MTAATMTTVKRQNLLFFYCKAIRKAGMEPSLLIYYPEASSNLMNNININTIQTNQTCAP
jgi:hypothetical protein